MKNQHNLSTSAIRRGYFFLIFLAVAVVCSACDPPPTPTPTPESAGVDPLFRAYYTHLGGQDTLRSAISPVLTEGQTRVQFTEAAKMVFDPQAAADRRFSLAPLGKRFEVEEPPAPQPAQPGLHYDGHVIHPDFWQRYEELGGARTVGRALSEMRYNPIRKRYEQYFENLGFYRLEGHSEVYLLSYGVWACGDLCRQVASIDSAIIDIFPFGDAIFQGQIDWLGLDIAGFPLSGAYVNQEGAWEQIFENIVLVTDAAGNPNSAHLRPISQELRYPEDAPKPNSGGTDMYFYAVEGNLGYEIPNFFWVYIVQHGGLSVFGPPMTHYNQVNARAHRQCFANLCLNYVPDEIENLRVRPEPLGYPYRLLFYNSRAVGATKTPKVTTLKVWESHPALSASQQQQISISVLGSSFPIEGVVAELIVTLPDGRQVSYSFPPTDANGRSALNVPPISAQNGTLIEYQVCVPSASGDKFCVGESFILWDYP